MKATRNQYEFASNIIWRNRERLNSEASAKEEQINALFYWIMGKVMNKVENCWPAQERHVVSIFAKSGFCIKTVIVQDFADKHFEPFPVDTQLPEEEFYEVMQEVSKIINSLPNFSAHYSESREEKYLKVILDMSEEKKCE